MGTAPFEIVSRSIIPIGSKPISIRPSQGIDKEAPSRNIPACLSFDPLNRKTVSPRELDLTLTIGRLRKISDREVGALLESSS